MSNWQVDYQKELDMAIAARQRRNEGQARVCARRAAGVAIREYYRRRGQSISNPSAYDLLQILMGDLSQPEAVRQSAAYLTLRVNEEFRLPAGLDLVKEAEFIAQTLLAE
jgi:hypothetical protein